MTHEFFGRGDSASALHPVFFNITHNAAVRIADMAANKPEITR